MTTALLAEEGRSRAAVSYAVVSFVGSVVAAAWVCRSDRRSEAAARRAVRGAGAHGILSFDTFPVSDLPGGSPRVVPGRLSLKNAPSSPLVTIVAAVFGGLALTSLKQELIPSIEFPQLAVVTTYRAPRPRSSRPMSRPRSRTPSAVSRDSSPRPRRARRTPRSSRRSSPTAPTWRGRSRSAAEDPRRDRAHQGPAPDSADTTVASASIDDFPVIRSPSRDSPTPRRRSRSCKTSVVPDLEDVAGGQRRADRRAAPPNA